MTIKEKIIETYPDEEFLFADGFDDAIIGIDSKFIICYNQDKCIEILSKEMTPDEAAEYFWYNVEGAYVGKQTPKFIKLFDLTDSYGEWQLDQYNRNRSQEDQVKTVSELRKKLDLMG